MEVNETLQLMGYVRNIDQQQRDQLAQLKDLYAVWNSKINLISRKDFDNFNERHVLHSLVLSKILPQTPGLVLVDVGTGGGFPGVPLAITRPDQHFHLVDATRKKVRAVEEICNALRLENVTLHHARIESWNLPVDGVLSRAVARTEQLLSWTVHLQRDHHMYNYYLLKGGDLGQELKPIRDWHIEVYPISRWVNLPYFETKKIVVLQKDMPRI